MPLHNSCSFQHTKEKEKFCRVCNINKNQEKTKAEAKLLQKISQKHFNLFLYYHSLKWNSMKNFIR